MSEAFWLAGTSIVGTAHVREGRSCEDALFMDRDDEGFVLVACDGAGSKKFGGEGARAVAPAIGRLLLANAEAVISRKLRPEVVVDVALEAIQRAKVSPDHSIEDYATTLVGLLVHGGKAMTVHVGDGAIFCLEGEFPRCISPPDRAPGGGPYTTFVTSKGVRPRMWLYSVPDYWTGFLCVTDGAEPALFNPVMAASSPLVTRLLCQFDLDGCRSKRESALEDTCRRELQPRSEDDITLVGARRVDVGGAWGCPLCHRPLSKVQLTADRATLFGYCRPCGQPAFRRQVPGAVVAEPTGIRIA
jgi:hypothetical protein